MLGIEASRTVLISYQHFAVENLVITEHVVNHLLIQILWWCRKGNLHATSLLDLQIDIARIRSVVNSSQSEDKL